MTIIDFYKNDPVHQHLSQASDMSRIFYGILLLDISSNFYISFAEGSVEDKDDYQTILNNFLSKLPNLENFEYNLNLTRLENILEIELDSGDNSIESAVSMFIHFINFLRYKKINELLYMDIEFHNMSDYIAQEYEIRKLRLSEEEIKQSAIMVEFHKLRLSIIEISQSIRIDSYTATKYQYLGSKYRSIISSLDFSSRIA